MRRSTVAPSRPHDNPPPARHAVRHPLFAVTGFAFAVVVVAALCLLGCLSVVSLLSETGTP